MLVHSLNMQMTPKSLYPAPGSVSGIALNSLIQVFFVIHRYHDSITCSNPKNGWDFVLSELRTSTSAPQGRQAPECRLQVQSDWLNLPGSSTPHPQSRNPRSVWKCVCESRHHPVDHLTPWAFEEMDVCLLAVYCKVGRSYFIRQK